MLNLSTFRDSSKETLLRFPATICFLAALTVHLIAYIVYGKSNEWLCFFFCVGMLLTLLLHICTEEKEEYRIFNVFRKPKTALLWFGSVALLAADCYYFHLRDIIDISICIAQGAIILAMLVAICFYPFIGEKDDWMSWNFVLRLVVGAVIGFLVGLIMLGGLCLLYMGTAVLFGFEPNTDVIESLCVLCLVTLPVMLFLIRIPSGEDKFNAIVPKNRFLLGVTKFLFLPLALLYMGVLYVYGLKILITWTLPDGMLSMLVSAMMCSLIGLTFLLYPYLRDEEYHGLEVRITRRLPLFSLPLLVLMSIGLGRRFIDYGVTANRLYMITFNIWLYVVALGLWLCKARRIHWISISFTILVLLTSVHPWNYSMIYRNILIGRFTELKEKYKIQPSDLTDYEYEKILAKMPKEDALIFNNTIHDIRSYDYKWAETLLGDGCIGVGYRSAEDTVVTVESPIDSYEMHYQYSLNNIPLVEGYRYVEYLDDIHSALTTDKTPSVEDDDAAYSCNDSTFVYHSEKYGDFLIHHKALDDDKVYTFKSRKGDAVLICTKLDISDSEENHRDMELHIDGYVLYNNPVE